MKNKFSMLPVSILVLTLVIPHSSFSQSRLPDGSIIYKDGSRRLPNGTVTYPRGTNTNTGINRTIDGILHPNNNTVYTNRYPRRTRNNGRWMPPGQAKKVYGGDASDYAPGHNKGKENRDGEDNHHGNEHGNGHGNGHNKHD